MACHTAPHTTRQPMFPSVTYDHWAMMQCVGQSRWDGCGVFLVSGWCVYRSWPQNRAGARSMPQPGWPLTRYRVFGKTPHKMAAAKRIQTDRGKPLGLPMRPALWQGRGLIAAPGGGGEGWFTHLQSRSGPTCVGGARAAARVVLLGGAPPPPPSRSRQQGPGGARLSAVSSRSRTEKPQPAKSLVWQPHV